MKTSRLQLECRACGSAAVFYSCTPNCCFNHVCGDCGAAFEPSTRALGGRLSGIEAPDPLPDSTDPTVACARCDSTAVYSLGDGRLVCAACGALLALELAE
jgi:hypothetical protein